MNAASTDHRPLALVTGASSGIGFELARQFLTNGFDVLAVAEDEELHTAGSQLSELGGTVQAERIDLADRGGTGRLVERLGELGRPVDAAAVNAGIGVGGPFVDNDLDRELRLIDLNVVSSVALAKHLARDMVARGRSHGGRGKRTGRDAEFTCDGTGRQRHSRRRGRRTQSQTP